MSDCINLVKIFIQTSKNIFSSFKGYCVILKMEINTIYQNINGQFIESAYDITKSSKINITQKIFPFSLPINVCSYFLMCLFHALIVDN